MVADSDARKKKRGKAVASPLELPWDRVSILEVVLQDELDHAVTALQVDLSEVVHGLRRVGEALRRVTDFAKWPVPSGASALTLHRVSSVRLMSPAMFVLANAWLNRLKKPTRNWNFCSPWTWKFLKSVKSWFMRVGVRMLFGGTRSPFSPNAGTAMQLRSRIFSPTSLPIQSWIARIDRRQCVACYPTTLRIRRPDDVGRAEVGGGDRFVRRIAGELEGDRDAARQRRDTGNLPAVQRATKNHVVEAPSCAIRQEGVPRDIQDVRAVGPQDAVGAGRVIRIHGREVIAQRALGFAKRVRDEVLAGASPSDGSGSAASSCSRWCHGSHRV